MEKLAIWNFLHYRGLDKAIYCLKNKRYEEIIDACNDEIKSYEELSTKAGVDGEDEYHAKINGTHDSEDEGISADDSQ